MLASSWLDLVVGVDIHLELVPSPAGPIPTPIPQPYVGLIGDPAGMVVAAIQDTVMSLVKNGDIEPPTGPVLINGFPATTTDETAKNTPLLPHVPMPPGTAYVKPPSGEATFPLGAIKVTFRDSNAVRLGEMALSCADPVPMPTSRVVVIPKGPPVMVMGAPGINIQQAAARPACPQSAHSDRFRGGCRQRHVPLGRHTSGGAAEVVIDAVPMPQVAVSSPFF